MVEKHGAELVVENIESGTKYRRNVAHAKRVGNEESLAVSEPGITNIASDSSSQVQVPIDAPAGQPVNNEASDPSRDIGTPADTDIQDAESSQERETRASRKRKAPARLQDFQLY